jgi:hypothetical protein
MANKKTTVMCSTMHIVQASFTCIYAMIKATYSPKILLGCNYRHYFHYAKEADSLNYSKWLASLPIIILFVREEPCSKW